MAFSFFNQKRKAQINGPSAAAIRYDPTTGAPTVTAQGHGQLARKIIELAKEKKIPLQENPVLVEHLISMDLGDQIPPQLYLVVAEVLLMVERMEKMVAPSLAPLTDEPDPDHPTEFPTTATTHSSESDADQPPRSMIGQSI